MNPYLILISVIALVLGGVMGFFIKNYLIAREIDKKQNSANQLLNEAERKSTEVVKESQDRAIKIVEAAEKDALGRRTEITRFEERLQSRSDQLDRRAEKIEDREHTISQRQSALDKRANKVEEMVEEVTAELEKVSLMTQAEAKALLLEEVEQEARNDMARIVREIEAEAQEQGERKARKLIADAIQRVASDHVEEVTSSTVPLPSDDMKGRIIGRNGRNIRAFEIAAGVDVIVDDTPESITISCFDSVRREVAKNAMQKLVLDGRIHPAHIETLIEKERENIEKVIVEAGEQAAYDAGVPGLHADILKMLGRLKFRTSYGQNQLAHSVESAQLASVLASEMGADVEIAKAGALLHDLGKAMDHNVEGTHAQLGAEFAARHGVGEKIVNTIAAHHHEVEQTSVEAIIVEAADAISGARPGARRESLEQYLKRVRALEDVANSYEGVKSSYALQAGREVRIFVRPNMIDDLAASRLARDISKTIEETMQYPGKIKVTVIRETRTVDYAK
ncbi:MAG: ribonuclease Y [Anaerolineales bacterium]|nr:ribonuclease Y [Anaerolineales bacterium]